MATDSVLIRLALPLAVLVATAAICTVFRYDVQAISGEAVVVHDRWSGTVKRCRAASTAPDGAAFPNRCNSLLSHYQAD